MKLKILIGWSLLLMIALPSLAFSQSINQGEFDAAMNEAMKYWQTPGAAIVVVRGDEVIYLKGFGVKDVKTKEPVTSDTVFAIGSTTKAFTTAAMAMLADEGKLSWDDPVRKHLPWFRLGDPLADESVTLRDLVTHRTGLSRHDMLWYNSPWGRDEVIRRIGFVTPTQPFRSVFQYQNIMFLTAGQVVGAISKGSYEDFVQQRIFNPLGMKSAGLSANTAEKAADHATPHQKQSGKIDVMPWRNIDNVGPAGSINASVRDLSNWIRLQLGDGVFEGKRLISAANLREMQTPQMVVRLEGRWKIFFPEEETNQVSYGLGWFVSDYRGRQLVMHGGTIDGFRANIMLFPKAKLGLAILSNLNGTQMPEATGYQIADLLLGLPKKDWHAYIGAQAKTFEAEQLKTITSRLNARKRETKPSLPLSGYTGAYEDPAYGKALIAIDGDKLLIQWSNFKSKLDHFHFDTFIAKDDRLATEQVVFTLGGDGEVSEMRFLDVRFKRLKLKS